MDGSNECYILNADGNAWTTRGGHECRWRMHSSEFPQELDMTEQMGFDGMDMDMSGLFGSAAYRRGGMMPQTPLRKYN